jgi:hypothetical protein
MARSNSGQVREPQSAEKEEHQSSERLQYGLCKHINLPLTEKQGAS